MGVYQMRQPAIMGYLRPMRLPAASMGARHRMDLRAMQTLELGHRAIPDEMR